MTHRKRMLAVLLALVMAAGMLPTTVFSAEEEPGTNEPVSPVLRVLGVDDADVTGNCSVVWTDRSGTVLEESFEVVPGTTVYYTVTPNDELMIDGVQYYTGVSDSVTLTHPDQPVEARLGQQGTVTVTLADKKTGEVVPWKDVEENENWSVSWYAADGYYSFCSEPTTPLCRTGEELTCHISLHGPLSDAYYSPDAKHFTVGFGPKTETVLLGIQVPELSMYEYERRISDNSNMTVCRNDNGYTFASVTVDGRPVIIGQDTVDYGSSEMNFNARFLASLGLGEHIFTFHYSETTAEDNYDTTLAMTQTKGDISEVRWRQSYRSSWSSFDNETYTGKPITKKPILYVGDWANDKRQSMLREGVDYTVEYENNVNVSTDENKARMILTGIGNYEGSMRVLDFSIRARSITDSSTYFEVTPNFDWPLVYNGGEQDLLNVTVKAGGVTLVKDADYTVEYDVDHWKDAAKAAVGESGLPVGSATESLAYPIRVNGIGNYSGTWTSWSNGSGTLDGYATEMQYRIMPRVETAVTGEIVEGWTWKLDPDGLLTVTGSGEMPKGFSSAYWVGGSDPDHYYKYGWRYDYKDMIKRVVVTGSVTGIEEHAFWDCTNLTEVTLPDTVQIIRAGAFNNCRSLRTVHAPGTKYLPSALETIQNGAFGGNVYNLTIWLPDNVTAIEVGNTNEYSRVFCKLGTATHETLKATGGVFQVEGYEGYYVEGGDNYNLGGTYTVYRYKGPGGDMVLPDFIDSITHYDIFSAAAGRVTSLTIPGSIKLLHGDAFRSLSNCTELIIEPGEMTSLVRGLLNGHGDTVLTIPDTVTEMPDGDFTSFYNSLTVVVGEGSAAYEWAIANGYVPDDGSGVGRMYRLERNSQPYITPRTAGVPADKLTDVSVRKSDGSYTFESLRNGDETLTPDTDYTLDGNVVTIRSSYLGKIGIGAYRITFHYTGSVDGVGPNDPVLLLSVLPKCRPVLTVLGYDGADVTEDCAVVWKYGSSTLSEPISVTNGTTLNYTVTPTDSLMIDGVQYYVSVSGEVTLTEAEQAVEVELGRRGTVTVTPVDGRTGSPLPVGNDRGYTVTWYGTDGYSAGTGMTSPLCDEGASLWYEISMTGVNAEDYPNLDRTRATAGFGPQTLAPEVTPYNKVTAAVTVLGFDGADVTAQCGVEWKKGNTVLTVPFTVNEGTTLTYTVTPGDALAIDGVQYYKAVSGSVTPYDAVTTVNVELGRTGRVRLAVLDAETGKPLPAGDDRGYTVRWYDSQTGRSAAAAGDVSPVRDEGASLWYEISMTGVNAEDYPEKERTEAIVGFGNKDITETLSHSNNLTLTVTGTKRSGGAVTSGDYEIFWYVKNDDGSFRQYHPHAVTLESGVKLLDLGDLAGTSLYYEIAPKDRSGILNWLEFRGIPRSEETKIAVTGVSQSVAIRLREVQSVKVSGRVTNIDAVGRENLKLGFSQEPWSGYATAGRSYYSYQNVWSDMAGQAVIQPDGTFRATVYDFQLSFKAEDTTGNFGNIYKTIAADNLTRTVELTFVPESLPGVLFVNIHRQHPAYGGTARSRLYYNNAQSQGVFTNMEFTLYNETKGKVIDPALYTVTPERLTFRDIDAMAGIVDTYDRLTLSVTLNGDADAVLTTAGDTVQIVHHYNGNDERYSFDLDYTEYGNAYLITETNADDAYAIYDADGKLAASGAMRRYTTTRALAAGSYTAVLWRKTDWVSPADTLEDMLSCFTGEFVGLYSSASFNVELGMQTRVELASTKPIVNRPLFTGDSGLTEERINCTAEQWLLVKLHYKVDPLVRQTHPDSRYEITVKTDRYAYYDPCVIPHYETGHTYGVFMPDRYFSLYVNGRRVDSGIRIDYIDAAHLGSVHGFTLQTGEPEGDLWFYVRAQKAGTFYMDAKAVMINPDGKTDRSGALGTTTLVAEAASASLNFASDYLRTADNGDGTNYVWVATAPGAKTTLYLDGVAIAETTAAYSGIASFDFLMSELAVGDAKRSAFTASDPMWRAAGMHELYAETDDGVRSATSVMECVTAANFSPAVLETLWITPYSDMPDPFSGRQMKLYHRFRTNQYFSNDYYSLGDQGRVFTYTFEAAVEDPETVGGIYVIASNDEGDQYIAELTRNPHNNNYSGSVSDERLLITDWSIVMVSKGRTSQTGSPLQPDDLIFDIVTERYVTAAELRSRIEAAYEEIGPEALAEQRQYEFDVWKDLLYEIVTLYYENPDDFDWDSFDGSAESMAALRGFFGYTDGVAADVDYGSWQEGGFQTGTTADGRTILRREAFTVEDGENWYNAWTVLLPTGDDPDGWSRTQRVDLGPAGARKRSARRGGENSTFKPKNYSSLINISGAAGAITRSYQKVTGRSQTPNNSNLGMLSRMTASYAGTSQSQMNGMSQKGLMDGLDDLTNQGFSDGDLDAGQSFVDAYNELSSLMNEGGYKNLNDCINGILNNLDQDKGADGADNILFALESYSDMMNGTYNGDEANLERLMTTHNGNQDAIRLLNALSDLQDGLRATGNRNFEIFNLKNAAKSVANGGGAGARPIRDPQGVVYEAVLSNTVDGAIATLYERAPDGTETVWNADEHNQINPQETVAGWYQWFVPEGEWQVRVTAPEGSGLSDNTSAGHPNANLDDGSTAGWLPVMPVQLGINIPLYSTASPEVAKISMDTDRAELTFSLYMDVSTLTEAIVLVKNGDTVIPCAIRFPDAEADPADGTRTYARTMLLTPLDGNGFDPGMTYTVSIAEGASAYNGKPLAAYTSDELSAEEARYEFAGWTWDGYTAAARFTDKLDGSTVTMNAVISVERTEPGCETAGSIAYTATVVFRWVEYTDTKAEPIPAPGHVWGEPEYIWAEDHKSAQAVFTCTECGDTVRTDATVTVTEDKGIRYYTASAVFGGKTFTSDPDNQKEYIEYTVRFVDWDGTVLSETKHHFNDTVTAPENPVREADDAYDYEFKGWDPAIAPVTGNAVYRAEYAEKAKIPAYKLGDVNGDGRVNASDYLLLKRIILRTARPTEDQSGRLDINGDGTVRANDYMLLKRIVLGTAAKT